MDRLKRKLDDINVTYSEKIFETENSIAEFGTEPFVSHQNIDHSILQSSNVVTSSYPQDRSIRIYIIATYAVHARSLLCEVARLPNISPKLSIRLSLLVCILPPLHIDTCPTHRHTVVAFIIPLTCSLLTGGMSRIGGK